MRTSFVVIAFLLPLLMIQVYPREDGKPNKLDRGTGGLTRQEAEQSVVLTMRQSECNYDDYSIIAPLVRARAYGDYNAKWVTCLVSKADSSLLFILIDEHTHQTLIVPDRYFPGLPAETRDLLSREYVLGRVKMKHSDITEPELFFCGQAADCVDCMSLGVLFWRFFDKQTGEEYLLNRKFAIIPACAARQAWFRFADSLRIIKE